MDLKVSLCLLLLGSVFVVEANLIKAKHVFQTTKNEEYTKKLKLNHDETVAEVWQSKTLDSEDPPVFFSPTFESNITGKMMRTLYDKPIYSFQGFRYATAERFQLPVKTDKFWEEDNFDAIHIGLKCPQHAYIGEQPSGDEDCLFLNVYTPYHPDDINENTTLPVMFFIHGGAFTTGDASLYLPTRLLDHDVILVTIHYRLGAFGFFTLLNEDAPGNMALYDMVAALEWTQTYIRDFGGNPDEVTIFGESAGSASVNYMMLVEPARGLFRAVIAESGSSLDHWAFDEDPLYAAYENARLNDCVKDTDEEILACMMEVPTADLVISQDKIVEDDRHQGLMGFRGVAPYIQDFELTNSNSSFEYIVTKRPREYLMHGDYEKVPFLTGSNRQEGSFVAGLMYKEFMLTNNLTSNNTYLREQMIQDILEGVGIEDDTHALATSLQKLYCGDIDLADTTVSINCIIDILGVVFLKAGSWEVADYHSFNSNQSTYYYSFEFESDDSMLPWLVGNVPFQDVAGITHSDELMYLFDFPAVMEGAQFDTVKRMTKMWTNFATYLDPTPEDQKDILADMGIPIWKPYEFENHNLLVIADVLENYKEFSDRWSISMDEYWSKNPTSTTEPPCTGQCADYQDQRDTFMAVMITFIVLTFVAILVAVYFFFKARR